MKYIFIIAIFMLHLLFPGAVMAGVDCKVTGGNWAVTGTLSFLPDDPVGTESDPISMTGAYHLECDNTDVTSHDVSISYRTGAPVANNGSGIYATDFIGVGIKMFFSVQNTVGFDRNCATTDFPLTFSFAGTMCVLSPETKGSLDVTGYVKFVKLTASVGGGVISKIPKFTSSYMVANVTPDTPGPDLWSGESNVMVDGIACKVNGGNIAVPIGNFKNTDFQQPGFTTGEAAFDVGLTCDPGANINVTLRGKQSPDTTDPSVLALSEGDGGAAQGVGVQILYEDKPLTIDERVPLRQSAGGDEVLSFSARYYQTKEQVTAGTANTVATLDLTYQ